MLGERGVNSSSHVSAASTVSRNCSSASPNGHAVWPMSSPSCVGSLHSWPPQDTQKLATSALRGSHVRGKWNSTQVAHWCGSCSPGRFHVVK